MKNIFLFLFLITFSLASTAGAPEKKSAASKLKEIQTKWKLAGSQVCGDITLTSYDKGMFNSMLYIYKDKVIAFDILKGEFEPKLAAALVDNKWKIKQKPTLADLEALVISTAKEHKVPLSDIMKCVAIFFK